MSDTMSKFYEEVANYRSEVSLELQKNANELGNIEASYQTGIIDYSEYFPKKLALMRRRSELQSNYRNAEEITLGKREPEGE